jgi:hypothetical protein
MEDSLNELLEFVPGVSRLHRMNVLLNEHEWEGHEEEDEGFRAVTTGERSYSIYTRNSSEAWSLGDYFSRRSGNGLPLKML